MTLSSMTGFGRSDGHFENYSWVWEIRSVNGKALDIRVRIPPGVDAFDQIVKSVLKKHISRGNVNVSLQLGRETGDSAVHINENALDQLVAVAKEASRKHDMPMPSIDNLLSIRDVVQIIDLQESDETLEERNNALKQSFDKAVNEFMKSRDSEGAEITLVISDIVNEIEKLLNESEEIAAAQPELIKTRFEEKIAALVDSNSGMDKERLTQEIVLLATKADVKEETDRLRAHITAARSLINEDGPIGRRFDFLIQEINREINTLCSKSSDIKLTEKGLLLKATADQLREQIQNVE